MSFKNCLLSLLFVTLCAAAFGADLPVAGDVAKPPSTRAVSSTAPTTAPAFALAERAISRFKLQPGIRATVFAAEPQLKNPVCLSMDERGRMWVVETDRFNGGGDTGVLDVRHLDWLEDDLACRTVEDRIAAVKKNMPPDKVAAMQVYSDHLVVIEDTDGDGRADCSRVFADGFNALEDGVAAGVLVRGDDVWFTDIPNLWLLRDTSGAGVATSRKALSTGYGVRYNFLGHDLHGLIFGPDGKLYFSIGDRGLHVKTQEGTTLDYPDTGSVLRCDPDGSNLEVFAYGLRNPQELAFDEFGNLFTGDNNCDMGDPARVVYLVEGGDSGWRVGYQHRHDPDNGGPWRTENMTALEADNTCRSIVPPVGHLGSGPSGLAYHPGTGLQDKYKNHFFLCDFRGGFTNSGVHSFALRPRGASFEMADAQEFAWSVLATDCTFGNDGGLYIADWTSGWERPEKGRIYRLGDPSVDKSQIVLETKRLIEEGMTKRSSEELARLLGHADMRVRQAVQFELVNRGETSIEVFANVLKSEAPLLARVHAIWGLGQLGRKAPTALQPVLGVVHDGDPEIRAQSLRVLADGKVASADEASIALLRDASPRVRFFAAMALAKLGKHDAVAPLLSLLEENQDKDAFLRHACVFALSKINDVPALLAAADNRSRAVRMGVLLALRRLGSPEVARFLGDADQQVRIEAARAIDDEPINAAMPQLAKALDGKGDQSRPFVRRALNANYRLGTPEAAKALADFAARDGALEDGRVEALSLLDQWAKPSNLDHVIGVWRPLPPREEASIKAADESVRSILPALLRSAPDRVRVAALPLLKRIGSDDPNVLTELIASKSASGAVRGAALETMAAMNDPKLPAAIDAALADRDTPKLRGAAIRLQSHTPDAVPRLAAILDSGDSAFDKQAAFTALGQIDSPGAEQLLLQWLDRLSYGSVAPEAQLDLYEAANDSKSTALKDRLKAYRRERDRDDPLFGYRESLFGGDADAGRKIFRERLEVSCVRCHKIGNEGGAAGPDLTHVASRANREYLLESIVFPNRKIAAGFESVSLKTKDGKTYNGVLRGESETELMLEIPDKGTQKIAKTDIVSRAGAPSPMPDDIGRALSRRDLRDLVEFLADQK